MYCPGIPARAFYFSWHLKVVISAAAKTKSTGVRPMKHAGSGTQKMTP